MGRALITDSATEPVSTADAKAHMRVTISDDDTYIAGLIKAARKHTERVAKRALIAQVWEQTYPGFAQEFDLTPGPLRTVDYIKYYDLDGTLQTLDTDVYQVDTAQEVGKVKLAYSQSWPTVRSGLYNSVTIRFTSGYGSDADGVPENIIHAIKFLVSHWYEVREPVVINSSANNVPMTFIDLMNLERSMELA